MAPTLTAGAIEALQAQYGRDTFRQRLGYFAGIVHPRHVLTTQAKVDAAKRCLQPGSAAAAAEVERARWTLAGATHPATGDLIPAPLRMAGWPMAGVFPVSGLLHTARFASGSLARTGGFQWWNQSQNAAVNASNGAVAAAEEAGEFSLGYVTAVAVALCLAGGSALLLRRHGHHGSLAKLRSFAPFPAVALANVCNTAVMRRGEIADGIPVVVIDGRGQEQLVGLSKVAAQRALGDTCVTRVVLPAINFVAGPILLSGWMAARGGLCSRTAMNALERVCACMGVSYVAFVAGIPISLALFPQTGRLPVEELEPPLQALAATIVGATAGDGHGGEDSFVSYNKGL